MTLINATRIFSAIVFLLSLYSASAQQRGATVDPRSLDEATFGQWVSGSETPLVLSAEQAKLGMRALVWTKAGPPHWMNTKFGVGPSAGVRHMRVGFKETVELGSVLACGGGALSVLKTDAPYPGDLNNESHWEAAERMSGAEVTTKEVEAGAYGVWVLPNRTRTRALRFTHVPTDTDKDFAGVFSGLWLIADRVANIAPQAMVQSPNRDDVSARLIDEKYNQWHAWDNGEQGAVEAVSPDKPVWVTLTWPRSVRLSAAALLWAGFEEAEVEVFTGSETDLVAGAPASKWRKLSERTGLKTAYPLNLDVQWVGFESNVETRAVRLKILRGFTSALGHLHDKVKGGKRVWLGELMTLSPLDEGEKLSSLLLPREAEEPPPIPISFTLPEAGVVTLVIEDSKGQRVRNLVSETPFPKGQNTAWWDGSDDLSRDTDAAHHGMYHIPKRLVAPGDYKIRGIWRKPLELHYEMSVYNAGKPAWPTADKTGGWMTTHTPVTSVACVPGSKTADGQPLVFIGASVAEGGHGVQWLREDGTKLGGQHWVGGHWTGAPTLAVDHGSAVLEHLCYVGAVWEGELRITAKTRDFGDKAVLKIKLGDEDDREPKKTGTAKKEKPLPPGKLEEFEGGEKTYVLSGLAARDGQVLCSMIRQNELLVVDCASGELRSRVPVSDPRGLCYDHAGRLLVLSGKKLLRFAALEAKPETLIAGGLQDPRHVTVDADGGLWVSDRGASHQVKHFTSAGLYVDALGKPGRPSVGPYEPLHMNEPNGFGLDSKGRVWVAEAHGAPRRVSVWDSKGKLARTFYGPSEYGGGGVLDPQDARKFFYRGMEFALDWEKGSDQLRRVFWLPSPLVEAHYGPYSPDTPLYPFDANPKITGNGKVPSGGARRFFTSCYTHNPTNGDDVAFVWQDNESTVRLVSALGNANAWPILKSAPFRELWPEGTKSDATSPRPEAMATFLWMDLNADGLPQPNEVHFLKGQCRGVTVDNDLSFVVSRLNGACLRFPAFWEAGRPAYNLASPENLGTQAGPAVSSGGGQSLTDGNGWTVHTNAPAPLSAHGIGGVFKGEVRWSYPSLWPGLHASHEAAVPDRPGMIVGHTRLLGGWIQSAVGPLFAVNGNMGNVYLLSADGMFVATLFHDIRLSNAWAFPVAKRNLDVTNVSLHDENFWPSITQTRDGKVFLVDGGRTSLVRVDGLDSLQALPESHISLGTDDLARARDWFVRAETKRQKTLGGGTLPVAVCASGQVPTVDGNLGDWASSTEWAVIDRRGTKANFNSDSKPYEVRGAITLSQTHLFAAWKTTEKNLLLNSGETPLAFFKHGGCLDLMLGTDAEADPARAEPVPGDLRLLVTKVKGQTRAFLYRAKVPGTTEPVPFRSPWRTVSIDVVEEVSEQVTFAADGEGNFELSVSLALLKWHPQPGKSYRADVGVLRGSGGDTTQRVYWSNKATGITADVPSEAELTPRLWGLWKVIKDN